MALIYRIKIFLSHHTTFAYIVYTVTWTDTQPRLTGMVYLGLIIIISK